MNRTREVWTGLFMKNEFLSRLSAWGIKKKVLSIASAVCAVALFLCFGLFFYAVIEPVVPDVMWATCLADLLFVLGLYIFVPDTIVSPIIRAAKVPPLRWFIGAIIVGICWIVGVFLSTWVSMNLSDPAYSSGYATVTSTFLSSIVLGLIVAPFCEECLIRGFCVSRLSEAFSPVVVAILSSLLFAGMHGTLTHLPLTFLLGLLLAGIRIEGAPLWHCMLVHSFSNFLSLFVSPLLRVEAWMVSAPFAHVMWIGACVAACCMVYFRFWRVKV